MTRKLFAMVIAACATLCAFAEPILFDVGFDANGGLFVTQVTSQWYFCEQTLGNEYSFPPFEPENPPLRFGGYWTEAVGGDMVNAYTVVTNDALNVLYAHWLDYDDVMVQFDANGGTVAPKWKTYRTGTTYMSLPVPTREHYDFVGWYVYGDYRTSVDVATKVIEYDHRLWARWTPSRYIIRFHANNGTLRTSDQTFNYETDVTLDRNRFSNGSLVFAGWSRTPGGMPVYGDGEHVGRIVALQDGIIHLYAFWTGPSYTVRFDSHGGIGRMENETFLLGQAQPLTSCAYTREGFEFAGWSRSTVGKPEFRDGATVKDLTQTENATVVLYAVWREKESMDGYVRVEANAECEGDDALGTVVMSPSSGIVKKGASVTLTARTASSRTLFVHWIDDYGEIAGTSTTLKVTPTRSTSYWAVFRSKAAAVKPELAYSDVFVGGGNEANGICHVKFNARIAVDDECLPVKFTAQNLPAGLKINPSTGEITGVPTKTGTYRTTIKVVSVANPALYDTATPKIRITNLPSWAMTTLDVYALADDGRTVLGTGRLSATSKGKISGKFNLSGTNWVFAASSFSGNAGGESILDERLFASGTATAKVGKKTVKTPWTWSISPIYIRSGLTSYSLRAVQGEGTMGNGGTITTKAWKNKKLIRKTAWNGLYDWVSPDGGKFWIKSSGAFYGKLASGQTVSGSGKVEWEGLEEDGSDLSCRVALYKAPYADKKKKKWPAFGALVELANETGRNLAGEYVAYRRQSVRAEVDWTSTGKGTLRYSPASGQAKEGETVTAIARPKKNSVFAYWLQDGVIVSYASSYRVTMGAADHTGLTAVFRLKSDFTSRPEMPYVVGSDIEHPFDAMRVGVAFRASVDIDETCRPVKFKAANLPKGLSISATTGVVAGTPTVAGKKTISITATSVAKPKLVSPALKIPVNVAKLDSWAIGTFKVKGALVRKNGTATLTVGKKGKISGKIIIDKKSYPFSAGSFASYAVCKNGGDSYPVYTGNAKVKYGGRTLPIEVTVSRRGSPSKTKVGIAIDGGEVYGYFATDYDVAGMLGGNCWKNAEALPIGASRTAHLVKEWEPEQKEYYDFDSGVAYFKFTAIRGNAYTVTVFPETGKALTVDVVDMSWFEDTDYVAPPWEMREHRDGTIQLFLGADDWDDDSPLRTTYYISLLGDVGDKATFTLQRGIVAAQGSAINPYPLHVGEELSSYSGELVYGEFCFTAELEADVEYRFGTVGGVPGNMLGLDIHGRGLEDGERIILDEWCDDYNEGYVFIPSKTDTYAITVSGSQPSGPFGLRYRRNQEGSN